MKTLGILLALVALSCTVLLAVVGGAFLFTTAYQPAPPVHEPECDEIIIAKNYYTKQWDRVCEITLDTNVTPPK